MYKKARLFRSLFVINYHFDNSRRNSISSTYGETSTLDNIIRVTERQDSALAWYYSDENGRHCTWSFYDITDMDPAELVGDDALEESIIQVQQQQGIKKRVYFIEMSNRAT